MGMKIAILGAESTGKSTLAHDLTRALQAVGTPALTVAEYLREWCDLHQRTPHSDEQAGIAMEQTRRVAAPHGVAVVCDTTSMMTAIYSDVLFQDISLYTEALADLRTYSHVLVMGLDLPWVEDGYQRDSPAGQQRVHQRLQTVLQEHDIAYSMVWGKAPCDSRRPCVSFYPTRWKTSAKPPNNTHVGLANVRSVPTRPVNTASSGLC